MFIGATHPCKSCSGCEYQGLRAPNMLVQIILLSSFYHLKSFLYHNLLYPKACSITLVKEITTPQVLPPTYKTWQLTNIYIVFISNTPYYLYDK